MYTHDKLGGRRREGGGQRERERERERENHTHTPNTHNFLTLRFCKNSSKLIVPFPSLSNCANSCFASYGKDN